MSKEKEVAKYNVSIGEYKGSPTLTIHEVLSDGTTAPYPFSFGKKKAKAILAVIDQIKTFVEESK